ncbi:MAG: hypothetical protein LBF72_02010 [Holosporales bacterium]|nr:hypothetical protein [Holosporales bacterium]
MKKLRKKASPDGRDVKQSTQRLFRPLKVGATYVFVCVGVLAFLLLSTIKHEALSYWIFEKVNLVTTYLLKPFELARRALKNAQDLLKGQEALLQEIGCLQRRVLQYEKKLIDYNAVKEENLFLQKVMPIVKTLDSSTITVRRPAPSQPFTVVTDIGGAIAENVSIGDVVVSVNGLFGRVVFKTANSVVILVVPNLQSRIPVRSRESKKKAILFGNNTPFLKIKYINEEADGDDVGMKQPLQNDFFQKRKDLEEFVEGEILETVSSGGFFQHGIPVARIERGSNGKLLAKWICSNDEDEFMTIVFRK